MLENHDRKVCEDDQKEFLNGWYVLVIISDLLAIIGSVLKIEIQAKVRAKPVLSFAGGGVPFPEPAGKASGMSPIPILCSVSLLSRRT